MKLFPTLESMIQVQVQDQLLNPVLCTPSVVPWTPEIPVIPASFTKPSEVIKTKPGPRNGTRCSAESCLETFWEANMYLVQIVVGREKRIYHDITHFADSHNSPLMKLIEVKI